MVQTFTALFYLKKPKNYVNGEVPIYLRITVNGKRSEVSIGRTVDPDAWNNKAGKLNGRGEATKQFNGYLDTIRLKLYDVQQELIQEGIHITSESLKNKYTGSSVKQRMLVPIFQRHNDEVEALVSKDFAAGTLERYKTSLSHTKQFLAWKFKLTDINIKQIDNEFISDYDYFLRFVRKCSNNTTIKYLKNFKKIIRICIANGWLDKDPFLKYKPKLKEVEREILNEQELERIIGKVFSNKRLNLVKDIFIFSCFTGLAYSDVKKITYHNLSIGVDGKKWLFVNRTKTDTASRIPLLPVALNILEKYQDHPQCINQQKLLPVLSNQKMNSYLKEVADLCDINKELTYHIARHTFATTVTLNNDVPIESVSKMLGHKNIRTTQHYAKILDKKVSNDMQALSDKFEKRSEQQNSIKIAN